MAETPQIRGNMQSSEKRGFLLQSDWRCFDTVQVMMEDRKAAELLRAHRAHGSSKLFMLKDTLYSTLGKISSYTEKKALEQASREVRKSLSLEALTKRDHQVMRLTRVKHSPHSLHKPANQGSEGKHCENHTPSHRERIRILFARKLLPGVTRGLRIPPVQEPFLSAFQTSLLYSHEQYPVHCAAGRSNLG